MDMELIRAALGWCGLINLGLLLWWFIALTVFHGLVYRLHSRFLPITEEQFNVVHYAAMAWFKQLVFTLNIVPYLALRIVM